MTVLIALAFRPKKNHRQRGKGKLGRFGSSPKPKSELYKRSAASAALCRKTTGVDYSGRPRGALNWPERGRPSQGLGPCGTGSPDRLVPSPTGLRVPYDNAACDRFRAPPKRALHDRQRSVTGPSMGCLIGAPVRRDSNRLAFNPKYHFAGRSASSINISRGECCNPSA